MRGNSIRRVALFLIFFSPALAYLAVSLSGGNTLLYEDGLLAFFPFRVFLHSAFVHGFSPQWVPNSAFGISLLAEGQSGISFPTTQIIYRTFSAEVGWIVEIFLNRLVAFALCYLLLRHLRVSQVGALLGSSVYAFCGLRSSPPTMWCYALLPGIFLSCYLFLERRPFSFVYLIAIFTLLFLTGHPVMIVYIGMIIFAFFVIQMMNVRPTAKPIREIGSRFFALLGTALVAALIASPQLLPLLEAFQFSARSVGTGLSLEALQNTVHLSPAWIPFSLLPTPSHFEDANFRSHAIRFPFYFLFLAFVGMLFGAKEPRRAYFLFLCVFSILMALGPYVGLWKFVHSLPVLEHFRFPFRWLFFLPICLAFFSARGLDYLLSRPRGSPPVRFSRVQQSILLAGLAGLGGLLLVRYHSELLQQTRKALEFSVWLTGLLWLCATGMVLAALLSLTKRATRRGVVLGVSLTIVSLCATLIYRIQDPMIVRHLETIGWKGGTPPNEPQAYRTSSAVATYEFWGAKTMPRHYHYTPNLTILNGTLTTGYYFSFFPYWSANVSKWCQDALNGDHKKRIYLNLSSARWLYMRDASLSERVSFPAEPIGKNKPHENLGAMSRASVVFSYRVFSDEGALVAFLESKDFDPRRELAILSKDAEVSGLPSDSNKPGATNIPSEATIVLERPDRIEIELEPPAPPGAFLVLSDTHYPGWRALADGAEEKVLRVNYAFRGIKLPEGAKRVVFFFDPLVPDAALILPTFLLAALGGAMLLRRFLIARRRTPALC